MAGIGLVFLSVGLLTGYLTSQREQRLQQFGRTANATVVRKWISPGALFRTPRAGLSACAGCHGSTATTRTGPPVPPAIFIGKARRVAPDSGSLDNPSRFSNA